MVPGPAKLSYRLVPFSLFFSKLNAVLPKRTIQTKLIHVLSAAVPESYRDSIDRGPTGSELKRHHQERKYPLRDVASTLHV